MTVEVSLQGLEGSTAVQVAEISLHGGDLPVPHPFVQVSSMFLYPGPPPPSLSLLAEWDGIQWVRLPTVSWDGTSWVGVT